MGALAQTLAPPHLRHADAPAAFWMFDDEYAAGVAAMRVHPASPAMANGYVCM